LPLDGRSLAAELRKRIRGEVRFDAGSRALYATDASNYRQVPIGVVLPRSAEEVVATVETCRKYGAPILSRGGGTSLAGQCCNVAVVMDMSKYFHRLLDLDPQGKRARVEPGIVLDDLRAAAETHGLTFGPDPATHTHCTLGGMIGNDSCGVHSVMAGRTADNVEALEILTYDGVRMRVGRTEEAKIDEIVHAGGRRGQIYAGLRDLRDRYAALIRERYPDIPRRVSGYNLDELLPEKGFQVARALVGSESTCVTVLEADVRLVDSPPFRALAVLGYPTVYDAADDVVAILEDGPVGLEGMDDRLIRDMRKKGLHTDNLGLLPQGKGWLLVEFGGETQEEADSRAREAARRAGSRKQGVDSRLCENKKVERAVWEIRESGLGATAMVPGSKLTWEGWEDAAVPPARLGAYLREFHSLLEEHGYHGDLYGHFGQGCVHTRIDFDLATGDGIAKYRAFVEAAADLVVRYGGSLSGEHGDGQSRAELLPRMFGPELVEAFREFKAIWDPEGGMNPGKVVDPYRLDENLRLGTAYKPWNPKTYFRFPDDENSFARAVLRCVGVGKCRREAGGTMCPSYMATREEKDSTRGRARLLFEMLQGEVIADRWRNEEVKDALDLCLACKGCKGDCPVNVDMATYKSEFLAHYYAGRLRPRAAYSMGWIHWWARLASKAPGITNFFTQTPPLAGLVKSLGGVAPQRRIPLFAPQTFKRWFHRRPKPAGSSSGARGRAILWPDTFNNHFHPETLRAAVEVLEEAGFEVEVPRASLCCGRPLYDWGMLRSARTLWKKTFDALGPAIREAVPVVGLEPSCVASFRDELIHLFPDDPEARRLSRQTYLLSEFLTQKAPDWPVPRFERKALVHGHCQHKAVLKIKSEQQLLDRMGLAYDLLDSGCCGMAGAFGFETDHFDVSMKIGERVLLPRVREAAEDTLIVSDGFSCREQIVQATGRKTLHVAQVLQMALHGDPAGGDPERRRP
jgi:FAD/FMN-containing dehydrogenase/Fe-S oxidoreductase